METINYETCRICKKKKPYTAAEFPLKSGVACADCTEKTSETFQNFYNIYSNSRPTPAQFKANIDFLRSVRKRYEVFSPSTDSCLYTADTLVMVDFTNRMLALFPTDCSDKRISADMERFHAEKRCEIFMFEDLKDANVLDSVNTDERFIMIGLKSSDAGYPSLVVVQRGEDGTENSELESLSKLFGYVLQSRRQK